MALILSVLPLTAQASGTEITAVGICFSEPVAGTPHDNYEPNHQITVNGESDIKNLVEGILGGSADSDGEELEEGYAYEAGKSYWFHYDAVQWAVEEGVTLRTGADTFSPLLNCDRSQIVASLYRYFAE